MHELNVEKRVPVALQSTDDDEDEPEPAPSPPEQSGAGLNDATVTPSWVLSPHAELFVLLISAHLQEVIADSESALLPQVL